MTDEFDDLNTVEEADDEPYVEFDISVSPSDPTLESLAQKIENGDMIVPFYQRRFVWKIEQASKLIESFLMGLPVPQVFLYVNDDDRLEIIDGQQRIMSVKYFFEGYFGEEDNRGRRQSFKLKGLSERSEYNGLTFEDLGEREKRRLRNSTLRAINIKQLTPNDNYNSVFHIFERLNTGGTALKPQEIRNAVYRGNIVAELQELNTDPDWQEILGLKAPDRGQRDVELILRLFGLFENWDDYEKPMLRYLNNVMSKNKEFDSEKAERFCDRFGEVTDLVNDTLDKPFRPKRVVNSSVLEAVMVALLEDASIDAKKLDANYDRLMVDEGFQEATSGATTDTAVLKSRIQIAKRILSA
ncbi:DUF262 domain-containing protein [Qipengyuania sp. GH1]|uniref:GmrSD restriction endonuclease domain-containing protein n=1 Tax=Qipengyuania aestuarii TaxID=2867241 RepID=UPI001C867678|nr:DUF262 domain-containing protein [Qipengyuania aestuarii]MBX7534455.1 DUF262 domain-containing protein [Qipengyuania aestuarii]